VNTTYLRSRSGLAAALSHDGGSTFGIELRAGWLAPPAAEAWRPLSIQLANEHALDPRVAALRSFGTVGIRSTPFGTTWDRGSTAFGWSLGVGGGTVAGSAGPRTDPSNITNPRQQPMGSAGLVSRSFFGQAGLQIDLQRVFLIERSADGVVEQVSTTQLWASWLLRLGGQPRTS
jgi:hypothetical protein